MRKIGIDVLVTPAMAYPAIDHNIIYLLNPTVIYTFLFNALDFPAGVVPIQNIASKHNSDQPNDLMTRLIKKSLSDEAILPHCV